MSIAVHTQSKRLPRDPDDLYPTGDGKPMAETDLHFRQMVDMIDSLQFHFAGRPDVYVAGNNFL